MLAEMTAEQFQEWITFFRIREEERTPGKMETGKAPDQETLQHKIMATMKGYQNRRTGEQ